MEVIRDTGSEMMLPLSWKLRLSYGVGHVLNDVCASMWFTYLMVFFHLVLGFESLKAGGILLIGQIADAVSTPFVGIQSDKDDNYWLCRYGRRKTWHLIGTICVLFSFPLIFSPCIGCESSHTSAQMVYYGAFVVIFQFGWASVQISHLSLIPELTPNDHQRTKLTAIRYFFTVLSNILIYLITWLSLRIGDDTDPADQIGPGDVHNFQRVVFVGLGIGFVASIIFHIGVKEVPRSSVSVTAKTTHRSISEFLCDIKLYQVAGVYMSTRLFVNLGQVYIPLYLHETLGSSAESLAIIPLVMFLSSLASSLYVHSLNKYAGRKLAYVFGALVGICACIWIRFGTGTNYVNYWIYGVSVLLGCGGSIMLVTSLGITADLIGTDTDTGAFVYGSMSFADKLSNGVAVILIQYFKCASVCVEYYRDILSYVCGGAATLGIISLLTLASLHRNRSSGLTDNSEESLHQDSSYQINTIG